MRRPARPTWPLLAAARRGISGWRALRIPGDAALCPRRRCVSAAAGALRTGSRGGSGEPSAHCRKRRRTNRCSKLWKVIAASRPPGASAANAASNPVESSHSSLLMWMRTAWKTRVAGCLPLAAGSGIGAHDDPGQIRGGGERPGAHDAPGDAPRMVFFAVALDHLGDLRHGGMVQPVLGGQLVALIHAHVQGAVGGVGKAAPGVVELGGRHADVEHHPGHAVNAGGVEMRRQVAEAAAPDFNARILPRQLVRAGDGLGVSVEHQQARIGGKRGEQPARVTAAPEGRVHVLAVGIPCQRRRHLAWHDGLVPGVVTIHGLWPPRCGGTACRPQTVAGLPQRQVPAPSAASPRRAPLPAPFYSMTSSSRCVTVESRRDLRGLLGRSRCATRSSSAAIRSRPTVPAC